MKWLYRHPRLYNLLDSVLNFGLSDLARVEFVRSLKKVLPQGKVLEVGIGTGKSIPLFKGDEFFGVDNSISMLLLAKKYTNPVRDKSLNGTNKLCVASAYKLPFKNHVFDIVLFIYTLRTIEKPRLALDEALRVGSETIVLEFKPLPKVFEWLGKKLFGSHNINAAGIFHGLNIDHSSYINQFDIYRIKKM
ncbi:MAG: methyltransferase domain-containing protein [bacterium]|nr:methyltransferase domain-containing protein [bacterium]